VGFDITHEKFKFTSTPVPCSITLSSTRFRLLDEVVARPEGFGFVASLALETFTSQRNGMTRSRGCGQKIVSTHHLVLLMVLCATSRGCFYLVVDHSGTGLIAVYTQPLFLYLSIILRFYLFLGYFIHLYHRFVVASRHCCVYR
jgi:hypothetical protein